MTQRSRRAERYVRLRLPAEEVLPWFESGCCAIAPDDAIRSELDSWPGVRTRERDLIAQSALVELAADAPPLEELLAALRDLGIEAHVVDASCDAAGNVFRATHPAGAMTTTMTVTVIDGPEPSSADLDGGPDDCDRDRV